MCIHDLKFVKKALEELDPAMKGCEDEPGYRTAIVLLAALELGPNVEALSRFTGFSPRHWSGTRSSCHGRLIRLFLGEPRFFD